MTDERKRSRMYIAKSNLNLSETSTDDESSNSSSTNGSLHSQVSDAIHQAIENLGSLNLMRDNPNNTDLPQSESVSSSLDLSSPPIKQPSNTVHARNISSEAEVEPDEKTQINSPSVSARNRSMSESSQRSTTSSRRARSQEPPSKRTHKMRLRATTLADTRRSMALQEARLAKSRTRIARKKTTNTTKPKESSIGNDDGKKKIQRRKSQFAHSAPSVSYNASNRSDDEVQLAVISPPQIMTLTRDSYGGTHIETPSGSSEFTDQHHEPDHITSDSTIHDARDLPTVSTSPSQSPILPTNSQLTPRVRRSSNNSEKSTLTDPISSGCFDQATQTECLDCLVSVGDENAPHFIMKKLVLKVRIDKKYHNVEIPVKIYISKQDGRVEVASAEFLN